MELNEMREETSAVVSQTSASLLFANLWARKDLGRRPA